MKTYYFVEQLMDGSTTIWEACSCNFDTKEEALVEYGSQLRRYTDHETKTMRIVKTTLETVWPPEPDEEEQ